MKFLYIGLFQYEVAIYFHAHHEQSFSCKTVNKTWSDYVTNV